MKNNNFGKSKLVLATITAAMLAACGGGGGGGVATPGVVAEPVQVPVPVPVVGTLVSSVPTPSFSAVSEELAAFDVLNAARGRCGFGLLAQSAQLDTAAKAHADYQLINVVLSHFESQTQFPTGFTGITGFDRAIAAGYGDAASVSDSIAAKIGSISKTGEGEAAMRRLLSAPYHMSGILGGFRDVGVAVRASNETSPQGGAPAVILQVNAGYKSAAGPQLIGNSDVATYPCAGSMNVNRQLTDESPSPVPGRDLEANPVGGAVYILLTEGSTLTIATATIVETVSNISITLRTPVTSVNDPNKVFKTHEGYIIPDAPLRALTQHTVNIKGSNNGVMFTKQFTFTTGA